MTSALPPCNHRCPVHTDARGYLEAITRGDYVRAAVLIKASNPFASVCSWVCSHPCEEACRRGTVDQPLGIRALKRFALEQAAKIGPMEHGPAACRYPEQWRSYASDAPLAKGRVAVVGAGPAGLTAALDLVRWGYRVKVFDRHADPGGHLQVSLPVYRLPREAVRQDIMEIKAAGVEFCCGTEVGKDIALAQLRRDYEAVVIAVGLSLSRTLPGFEYPQVLLALPFLQNANAGRPTGAGNRVLVLGGGDVAMDVARTAIRIGAAEVTVTCLERRWEMPAHAWEIEEALAEGVSIAPGFGPVRVIVEDNSVTGLEVKEVKAVFDAFGCFNPVYYEDRRTTLACDTIILAIGQQADLSFLEGSGIPFPGGRLTVDQTSATPVAGIFACGEVAQGPGPAIAAIAGGHRAAVAVDRYLRGLGPVPVIDLHESIGELPPAVRDRLPVYPRREPQLMEARVRKKSFASLELGYAGDDAPAEAERCLRCGLGAEVRAEKCAACLTCLRVCPYGAPIMNWRASISEEACQACGICAAACPAGAITVRGLRDVDVRKAIRRVKEKSLVVFVCQRTVCYGILPGELEQILPGGAAVIKLPTVKALQVGWILEALEAGAAGVLVVTCPPGNCRHLGGASNLEEELNRAGQLLDVVGVGARRLLISSPASGEDLHKDVNGFDLFVRQG